MPKNTNGCPVTKFKLYMNDGAGGSITILAGEFEPQISSTTITSFVEADTSKDYKYTIVSLTAGGQVLSGESQYRLASVPGKPNAPTNLAAETNDSQIGVSFSESLPDNGGSEIINIQLWMDDA